MKIIEEEANSSYNVNRCNCDDLNCVARRGTGACIDGITVRDEKEAKKLRIIGKYFVEAIKQRIMNFDFDEFMNDLPHDCLLEFEALNNEIINTIHEFDPS